MRTDEVEVGGLYEVPGELKPHHLASSGRGYDWDDRGPGRVLEKGLPYGEEGNVGVRMEFEMPPCPACDHGWVVDEDGATTDEWQSVEVVIPAVMLLRRWDQQDLRRTE